MLDKVNSWLQKIINIAVLNLGLSSGKKVLTIRGFIYEGGHSS